MSAPSPSMSDFAATQLPIKQASALPGFCYTSQEWYERERGHTLLAIEQQLLEELRFRSIRRRNPSTTLPARWDSF
jgi:hypothetical protein